MDIIFHFALFYPGAYNNPGSFLLSPGDLTLGRTQLTERLEEYCSENNESWGINQDS